MRQSRARMFDFVPLPLNLLATALGIVVLYVLATEAAKRLVFRTSPAPRSTP